MDNDHNRTGDQIGNCLAGHMGVVARQCANNLMNRP